MDFDIQVYISKTDLALYRNSGELQLRPQTEGSAGIDVLATHDETIYPGKRSLIKTGLHTAFSREYVLDVRPRSGLALKKGITVLNTPGTVDSDYRNEIGVILINHGENPVVVKRGDRIAQFVFTRAYVPNINLVDDLSQLGTTDRKGGFGHTGGVE
jgi:dUTP pyrophosphatase